MAKVSMLLAYSYRNTCFIPLCCLLMTCINCKTATAPGFFMKFNIIIYDSENG